MSERSAPLLSVENLSVEYRLRGVLRRGKAVRAVEDVSFDIGAGEAVAVVGESGCGKSSLARAVLGLVAPARGRVRFDGRDLSDLTRTEWRALRGAIGYMAQDPFGALPPFFTVERALEEPLRIAGVSRAERAARIRAALSEVALGGELLSKFPHELSGGQAQRVCLARALLRGPRLLVADEPVSMLDASVRIAVLDLLDEIRRKRNLALLFVTHDLATVRHYADRVLVMYAGRIVEEAPAGALVAAPLHPYTKALLSAIPEPAPGRAGTPRPVPPGEPPDLAAPPAGCRFHPRCAEAVRAGIAGRCAAEPPALLPAGPGRRAACFLCERS